MWLNGSFCEFFAGKHRAWGPAVTFPFYSDYVPRHRICPECGR